MGPPPGVGIYLVEHPMGAPSSCVVFSGSAGMDLEGGNTQNEADPGRWEGNGPQHLTWRHLPFQMDPVYADIEGYRGIKVHSLR